MIVCTLMKTKSHSSSTSAHKIQGLFFYKELFLQKFGKKFFIYYVQKRFLIEINSPAAYVLKKLQQNKKMSFSTREVHFFNDLFSLCE